MNVKYILTAALLGTPWDEQTKAYTQDGLLRKAEYEMGFKAALKFSPTVYAVESISKEDQTELNQFTNNILYVNKEHSRRLSKGEELTAVDMAIQYFKFDDNDFLIKCTGRYQMMSNKIESLVEEDTDFIAKVKNSRWISTNCIGMKVKHWKSCASHIINPNIAPEKKVANWFQINKEKLKYKYVDILDITTFDVSHNKFYR